MLSGYVCFYERKAVYVYAAGVYAAQCAAGEKLGLPAKKWWRIGVALAERPNGSQVVHAAVD
jgi:hypothetical protein